MGRVSRWFRSIFGGKEKPAPADEKSKWGFSKSFREKGGRPQQPRRKEAAAAAAAPSARAAEQRRGSYRGPSLSREWAMDGEDQTKRAIAVAAATAAVAEAAVVAAQAAAAVVRLTSSGRCITRYGGVKREEWAAVRIQAAFRGYLARRALRALKGLVKLQALVRGNIVRKRAAETLRCMQALVRVQSRARACRALPSQNSKPIKNNNRPRSGSQRTESFEAQHSSNSDQAYNPKRNSPKSSSSRDGIDPNRAQSSSWQWLDSWIEERYRESPPIDDEKDAKILQIDAGKPQPNSRRRSNRHNDTCSSRSVRSPSMSSVEIQRCLGSLRLPPATDVSESPQFYSAASKQGNCSRGGGSNFSPARSDCSAVSMYSGFPNYMANTESSRAKFRSQSAPKQRPEYEKLGSVKSAASNEYGNGRLAAKAEVSRRSSSLRSKFSGRGYPGSGRLDRLGIPEGF